MKTPLQRPGWVEKWGLAARIQEPGRTLLALATFTIMVVVHPAVHELWYHHVPVSLEVIAGTLQTLGPIPSLAMLSIIGPRLWRAGARTRVVGIGALVAAILVSAWGFAIALDKFGLRPH